MSRKYNEADFWNKVLIVNEDACWLWDGYVLASGYGKVGYQGATYRAHRLAWILTNGAIPNGLVVMHKCDNPLCVNPNHLDLGTSADNQADKVRKGRQAFGIRNGCYTHPETRRIGKLNGRAKLTQALASAIRLRYSAGNISQAQLAEEYSVSQATVSRVVLGQAWFADE